MKRIGRSIKIMIFLFLFSILLSSEINCQIFSKDSCRNHSPDKAMIMSAILPGLGQIYNNKVWKVPVLYGGAGVSIYFLNYYQRRYAEVLSIQRRLFYGETPQESYYVFGKEIPNDNLDRARRTYGNYRDTNGFILLGIYLLNIIDAKVDAYMFEYDVSDELSLEINPVCIPVDFNQGGAGLSICLKF